MTTLPGDVLAAVQTALTRRAGGPVAVTDSAPVGGGCISPTARLETEAGTFFLKWDSPDLPDGLLAAEARGLRQLGAADEVRVPAVVAESGSDAPAWLLAEWLQPETAGRGEWEHLGAGLAALHRHTTDRFGADADNYIGSLPQANDPLDDWPGFWRARRLEPQLRQAVDRGLLGTEDRSRFDALFARLDEILAAGNEDGPSLLHGDLWSGNVHMTTNGPAIIDPSVYYGHREVDLAMSELFGGFGPEFYFAYEDVWPLDPGYDPTRRAVYQLYYLLVHVNLFGGGYVGRTRSALGTTGF